SEDDEQPRYQRVYEGGGLYTPIVGSFRSYGASGIESTENSLLDGSDDQLAVRNFRDVLTGREPEGANVQLTIDPAVQEAGYNGFVDQGKNGAAVAIDPGTGAILGAVPTLPTTPTTSPASRTRKSPTTTGWSWSRTRTNPC